MVDSNMFFAAKTSSRWLERKSKRPFTSSYCSIASTLTGPSALMSFSMLFSWFSAAARFSTGFACSLAWSKLCMNSSVICVKSLFKRSACFSRLASALACWRIHSSLFLRACSICSATSSAWPSKSSSSKRFRMIPCSKSVFLACACVNWLDSCSTSTVWTWAWPCSISNCNWCSSTSNWAIVSSNRLASVCS